MKTRGQRTIAIYALVAALLITTVAYAALQTSLSISGTVTKKGGSWNIYFTNVVEGKPVGDATLSVDDLTGNATNLTFSASLTKPLDSVSFTVDVVNDGSIDAQLSSLTLTGVEEAKAKDVTYTVTYADGKTPTEGDSLKVDETRTLLVTVSYDNVDTITGGDVELNLGATMLYIQADQTVTPTPGGDANETPQEVVTNYTQEDIDASNGKLVAVGATNALDVVGAYSEDWTTLTITKNGQNSDGKIKKDAFNNGKINSKTVNLIIENGITSIGDKAFFITNGSPSLANVTIADTVTTIGEQAFYSPNTSVHYISNITLGSGVKTIGQKAFYGIEITEITIPIGMTIIDFNVFGKCDKLTTVNLPSTITSIEIAAFEGTTALTDINFNGTIEEWNAITLGNDPAWDSGSGDYTIHCTDGDIAKA